VGLPWGLDQVDRVPVARVKRVTVGALSKDEEESETGQLLTGDHNLVNVQAEILYTVLENQVEKFVLAADRADALVARAAEAALAEWIAGRTVDEVLLRARRCCPSSWSRACKIAWPVTISASASSRPALASSIRPRKCGRL